MCFRRVIWERKGKNEVKPTRTVYLFQVKRLGVSAIFSVTRRELLILKKQMYQWIKENWMSSKYYEKSFSKDTKIRDIQNASHSVAISK